ncbi:peptide-methionine (R)-S-oxide reductase MsrB [Pseudoalteromonas sp. MMG010]|uniref:peptide-methionine (R)-S-oxide reductase MsrB n=1 Tax=Pseudoalteromonas sp. MMG010 TaxID=2822685 RepID=UPI001B39FC26|nr:peptide-methionine (R)-S-oxide reductase MsrB [Pseudoalteromonas sp. MMG010]MBQ4834548.1 peptide-methionine (R)-S-oxide reductase MsrB [Pseudoalteromonas sp. MMG010]
MLTWKDIIHFASHGNPQAEHKVIKTDAQWQAQLTPEQYYVTRNKGTEYPNSNSSCDILEPGEYSCVCCDNLLFDGNEKFASGSGWPSFTQPAAISAIAYILDNSHGMERVEVICNVCDAHLGHIFPDGPPPSRLRYCVNALAMKKVS